MSRRQRSVFNGEICGFGTTSGHRFVVGRWTESPLGSFTDVMHETPDGFRTLLAPNPAVAEFVQQTYTFDAVVEVPVVSVRSAAALTVDAGLLYAEVSLGDRTPLGMLLRTVPRPLARAPFWCTTIDPIARVVMKGVRTRGTAGNDRQEWYGATDARRVTAVHCTLDSVDLGTLADVWPPVRFGFGSTPRVPTIVSVTTTIETKHRK